MAIQTRPQIVQDANTGKWYIVTSWHKPGHPAKKYEITNDIQALIKHAIDAFIRQVEKEHREAEDAMKKAE